MRRNVRPVKKYADLIRSVRDLIKAIKTQREYQLIFEECPEDDIDKATKAVERILDEMK